MSKNKKGRDGEKRENKFLDLILKEGMEGNNMNENEEGEGIIEMERRERIIMEGR